ncbi:MAG: hypothetical protein HXY20_13590 [Acidobacteria bacterium]|nr:hypothetical protein [Acidobacteriota bacterium]
MKSILLLTLRVSCNLVGLLALTLPPAFVEAAEKPGDPVQTGASEIEQLKRQIAAQQGQMDRLRRRLEEQQTMLEAVLRSIARPAGNETASGLRQDGLTVQSATPLPVVAPVGRIAPTQSSGQEPGRLGQSAEQPQPLSFGIGSAQITPVGFIDLTAYVRKGSLGSGLGTSFAGIPFENSVNGRLREVRLSSQGTRMGFRLDAPVRGARLLGYLESDFNGGVPGNMAVTGNSATWRLRLAWVNLSVGKLDVLGGQSWSLLTPNRRGVSALPADLFTTQGLDPNQHVGLPWTRSPQLRVAYRAGRRWAVGLSLENPEQYIGGSAGAGVSVFPQQLAYAYAGQLSSGAAALSTPNAAPDLVVKVATDRSFAGRPVHVEAAGIMRQFRVYNPLTQATCGAAGGGGGLNASLEPLRHIRLLLNGLYSNGGGRYMIGLGPDLIIRGDGSPSPVRAFSTIDGFELEAGRRTNVYAYYGGVYFQRNTAVDPAGGKAVGYGFAGSPSNHNRAIQQFTFGISHTLWRDPQFGGLQVNTQYSRVLRHPWDMPPDQPRSAQMHMLYLNLRYLWPGAPPAKLLTTDD